MVLVNYYILMTILNNTEIAIHFYCVNYLNGLKSKLFKEVGFKLTVVSVFCSDTLNQHELSQYLFLINNANGLINKNR